MTKLDLSAERIAWLDLESTGLRPEEGHKLLQVAAIVTDGHLEEVGDPFQVKIRYTEEEVAAMKAMAVPFVQDMHTATGLWDALPTEGVGLAAAEFNLLRFFKENIPVEGSARLGGNSITLDRNFMNAYMPKAHSWLHYRSLDMTSVAGFFEYMRPEITYFEKAKSHDALDDIRESLAEARYYGDFLRQFVYYSDQASVYTAPSAGPSIHPTIRPL